MSARITRIIEKSRRADLVGEIGQTHNRASAKSASEEKERERERGGGVVIHLAADNHKLLDGSFFSFIINNRWENRVAAR